MGNAAGNIQPPEKSSGQLFRPFLLIAFQSGKGYGLLHQLFPFLFIGHVKAAEIINIFINSQLIKNRHILHHDTDLPFDLIAVRPHLFSEDLNASFIKF